MKNTNEKIYYLIYASVTIYVVVSMVVVSFLSRNTWSNVELIIPGAIVLIATIILWAAFFEKYKNGGVVFFLAGFTLIICISIIYPALRTGALWQNLGDQGGAVLIMIIFMSLVSQLSGFVIGFLPATLFIKSCISSDQNAT